MGMDDIVLAGSATSLAAVFTNPIEVVKTRMQVQGELSAKHAHPVVYRNPLQAFFKIARQEGVRSLQAGLATGMMYQFAMNGTRLGLFDLLRPTVMELTGGESVGYGTQFIRDLALGCGSGAAGAFLGSPFFLIKCRMQTYSPQNPIGAQHGYKSVAEGFRDVIRSDGGYTGLFRGAQAAMLRVSVGGGTQISVYTSAKSYIESLRIIEDGVRLHVAASLLTGLAVTITMNPFDVVSTRLYNQQVTTTGATVYSGPLDCIRKTLRNEGARGFYKGFFAHYLRLGPHTILTFVFWEKLKSLWHNKT